MRSPCWTPGGGQQLPDHRPDLPAANPLLVSLSFEHIKPRLLGHWGTSPGLSFVYAHASRLIQHRSGNDLPGRSRPWRSGAGRGELPRGHVHGGLSGGDPGRRGHAPAVPSVLLTRRYPEPRVGADAGFDPRGRRAGLCPGPRVRSRDGQSGPDRPRRGRRRRGGDRPAGGSWKGISFLNPTRDGAVLPILHLNGAKIAGPTVLARKDPAEVRSLLEGTGTTSSRSPATTCQGCTTGSPKPWRAPGRVSAVSRRLPVAAAGTVYAHGGR